MAKFRKKPIVVEAVQLGDHISSIRKVLEFMGQEVNTATEIAARKFEEYCDSIRTNGLTIYTLEDGNDRRAKHVATTDDYIIKGIQGEFYPCKPDIFEATYEVCND